MPWGDAMLALRAPYDAGLRARHAGQEAYDNPHRWGSNEWESWRRGWNAADIICWARAREQRQELELLRTPRRVTSVTTSRAVTPSR